MRSNQDNGFDGHIEFDPTYYGSSRIQMTGWPPEVIQTRHSNHFTPVSSYPDKVDIQHRPTFSDMTPGFDSHVGSFDMFNQPYSETPATDEGMMVDQWDQGSFCNDILDSFMSHN